MHMKEPTTTETLGTEDVRWDLSCFYNGISDPQITADTAAWEKSAVKFEKDFKGKLTTRLGKSIQAYIALDELGNKIMSYLFLMKSLNETDEDVKTKMDEFQKVFSRVSGEHLTFFELELAQVPEKYVTAQAKADKTVAFHMPWIKDIQKRKPHLLNETVESALAKRAMFGPSSWDRFYDEEEALLTFPFEGKFLDQSQLLNVLEVAQESSRRAEALKVFNEGLQGNFARLSAETLNMIVGLKQVEDRERKYPHPMAARNMDNKIPDDAVAALHEAIATEGARLAARYYTLKGRILGIRPLLWSDRNAPLPLEKNKKLISYPEAIALVLEAYESFSPTLRRIVANMADQKRIDAPRIPGKASGAFNAPLTLPGHTPHCFTLLNYLGTERDVMTLAHELGHGVHGILAGEAQGVLMQQAPIALAETASVFGEMTTFNFLKKRASHEDSPEKLLALMMGKLGDMANTAVRQISFSFFEQEVHASPRRLSVSDFCKIWRRVTEKLLGKDGVVFVYKNHEYLWAYIPHFHTPFYVYGYAFGEILTQSLYAAQDRFKKEEFETLYLDLLRAGSSKGPKELLKPFGLDPTKPDFWKLGLTPIDTLLGEAEALASKCGIK